MPVLESVHLDVIKPRLCGREEGAETVYRERKGHRGIAVHLSTMDT
ncbi:MAG TPA: hypothetical protein VLC51_07285 [Nitrospira sp.]|nr:hypothetical protein [Nitrospira sp.]